MDIRFRNNAKSYFFDPNGLTLAVGDHVIIDTARGDEFGICAAGNHAVRPRELVLPLRKVLRAATAQDERCLLYTSPDYNTGRKYWNKLKQRLKDEGSELVTNCHQLKMRAADGKNRLTDIADAAQLPEQTEGDTNGK